MGLRKYFTLTRMGIIEALHYRLSLYVKIIGNLLYLILIYYLWKAIFHSAGTDVVNGMTFESTMVYLVLASALYGFMEMYVVWEIGRNIQKGDIVVYMLKPMEYRHYLFWELSGSLIVGFLTTVLPTFIVVAIVTHGTIPLGINLAYFVLSVALAMIINFQIDFMVGNICFFTESIWGINMMKQVIVLLLSGATIPIAFFPEAIKNVVNVLPFVAIYDSPLTILLNGNGDSAMVMEKLLIQLGWAVGLTILSHIFWKISVRQVTVNGG
jgi:ABC-2 type transport system permease protein